MENLLTYILQVNLLLALLYLGYYLLLKSLTFYKLNRVYLLIGSLYAFIYPFLHIKSWFVGSQKLLGQDISVVWLKMLEDSNDLKKQTFISLLDVVIFVLGAVACFFILRLIMQLFSLVRVHLLSKNAFWQSYMFRDVMFPVVPFSFFNKIYLHIAQHEDDELKDIFAHETIHVKGNHTIDILLFEILLVVCWYNPFVWLMRKAVRQNLEFLTDQQVLDKGINKQTYQYSLLHVTQRGVAVGMSNHFNFITLKKRIMMMNKKRSSKLELSKYAFLLPVFLIAGASFTVSKAEQNLEKIVEKSQNTTVINEPLQVKMKAEVGELLNNTIGTDIISIDTSKKENEYPLVAPDFDRKELEGKNLHFEIDGKLVSLDEFLEFPRTEIAGVDIYKDAEEIYKKIGKKNSEGLFVMTSKNKKPVQTQIDVKRLKSKSEIDNAKKFIYDYDGKILSKSDFLAIADENLKQLTQVISRSIMKGKYGSLVSNWEDYDGVIHAISEQGEEKLKEQREKALYIVDGVDKGKGFDLSVIKTDDIESVTVHKGDRATSLYGDNGINGVIEIATKNYKNTNAFSILEGKLFSDLPNKPLVLVDGEEVDVDKNTLKTLDINSFSILKREAGTSLYGDKAKDGVILIITKKNSNNAVTVKGYQADGVKSDASNSDAKSSNHEVTVTGHKK